MARNSPPPRSGRRQWSSARAGEVLVEILLRILLAAIFCYMETMPPFTRYVSPAALEIDYKHPRRDSYVPPRVMWAVVLCAPCLAAVVARLSRSAVDAQESILAVTLAMGINGIFTNTIKLISGRLRPDYFYRCFPDGVVTPDLACTGDPKTVMDGRKSFPSGHSSFSFCSLGFVSIWAMGRLGVCRGGRNSGPRTVLCLAPVYVALVIALSRSCDYHHHWEDIFVGSALGLTTAYTCYRQRYPALSSELSGVPYAAQQCPMQTASNGTESPDETDTKPLLNGTQKDSKWI